MAEGIRALGGVQGMAEVTVRVALPVPLRRAFDYRHPTPLAPGVRVRVPFGRRVLAGIVLASPVAAPPGIALRAIAEVIDEAPLLNAEQLGLLQFVADYYHHAIGEVVFTALPSALKRGLVLTPPKAYRLTPAGARSDAPPFPARAHRRRALWQALKDRGPLAEGDVTALARGLKPVLAALVREGLVEVCEHPRPAGAPPAAGPVLRPDQEAACAAVRAALGTFQAFLLFGVTGSGKTEVYLELIAAARARGDQALILVPEIGLTPQLMARFRARLPDGLGVLHSGLSETERARVWGQAARGELTVIVGTRSAVFAPLKRLGLIIVDEEHDGSLKQQDGLRYHARDIAIVRAQRAGVPVVLGSATPALESYRHALDGRYRLLRLPGRGPDRSLPRVTILDMGREAADGGLGPTLLAALRARLLRREQALVFLNRRGYAPVLLCPECRWHAPCERCDARLTVHLARKTLRCHHCGHERPLPATCPRCGHGRLLRVGEGTQRLEETLARALPEARIARIDRDTVTSRLAFEDLLTRMRARDIDILVGTQMLAKGHDFADLTLVGVVNADQGLFGSDFRADEQLFAQIMQVAGRAGRAAKAGEVIIQTHHPHHPLWSPLVALDYEAFAEVALKDRYETGFPPYAHCALLRAEALKPELPLRFLETARALGQGSEAVTLGSVLPATLARRAGYYRAQLLVTSAHRPLLQAWLTTWVERIAQLPAGRQVRWSLDVDPHSLF